MLTRFIDQYHKSVMSLGYRVAVMVKGGVKMDDSVLPHFPENFVHTDMQRFRQFFLALRTYLN